VKPTTRLRCGVVGGLAALLLLPACQSPATTATSPTAGKPTLAASSPPAPSTTAAAPSTPPSTPAADRGAQLPRGGHTLFPEYRLVGFAGAPGAPALGRLGIGDLDERLRELEKRAATFGSDRQPQPVLELLTTIVQGSPGRDGKWRSRLPEATIQRYLDAARRHRAILLIGIQPGRSTFLAEVKAYEKWLRLPDVGLALDPEWAMKRGQVPMRVFGHTTGSEINQVTGWVSTLVAAHRLPEKPVVVHELAPNIIRDESAIVPRQGVALIKSVDGIGSRAMKVETWRKLTATLPKGMTAGFKLFFEEDAKFGPLMTPSQVLALKPEPEYVVFE